MKKTFLPMKGGRYSQEESAICRSAHDGRITYERTTESAYRKWIPLSDAGQRLSDDSVSCCEKEVYYD